MSVFCLAAIVTMRFLVLLCFGYSAAEVEILHSQVPTIYDGSPRISSDYLLNFAISN